MRSRDRRPFLLGWSWRPSQVGWRPLRCCVSIRPVAKSNTILKAQEYQATDAYSDASRMLIIHRVFPHYPHQPVALVLNATMLAHCGRRMPVLVDSWSTDTGLTRSLTLRSASSRLDPHADVLDFLFYMPCFSIDYPCFSAHGLLTITLFCCRPCPTYTFGEAEAWGLGGSSKQDVTRMASNRLANGTQ